MNIVKKKLDELKISEKNVRKHPQKQIEEMKRSLDSFGQYRPLVVASDGEILVGNGLYEALKLRGDETVDCIVLPEDTPTEYKRKLMLADNKLFTLGFDDVNNIDEIMKELSDFDIAGFDEDVLTQLYTDMEDMSENMNEISGMGTVRPERINEIKNVEQDRIENPPQPQIVDVNQPNAYDPLPSTELEDRNYMNCPHCGAKIWQ